jgi:8-oxo-dGTP pyrophosphatase MutT (NUDIX family)
MDINPKLNEIDDCLYRVATKAIITENDKVLLVKEIPEMWWGFPGGGVVHGEDVHTSLLRELEEELGVPSDQISASSEIAHHAIGAVVSGVPRMSLFYRVNFPTELLQSTDQVAELGWFSRAEFMELFMGPTYSDRSELAKVVFDITS